MSSEEKTPMNRLRRMRCLRSKATSIIVRIVGLYLIS